jgi:hypothetical protein
MRKQRERETEREADEAQSRHTHTVSPLSRNNPNFVRMLQEERERGSEISAVLISAVVNIHKDLK